ncbi:metalloregulator ArsR/SmtB family transcription factor [Thioclava sp. GXIMD2076]|uniref:ArsR/SmtB family transcription factor n=1 Tax=unclassified Thioclava TaxID=2621713 RepID=UPI0030D10C4A
MSKRKPERVCHSVEEASELVKHLANPNRLAVMCHLMDAPRSVTELEEDLGIPQPTLSQQLSILRDADLIVGMRQARSVIYRIEDARVLPLIQALRLIFAELNDLLMQKRSNFPGDMDMFD